MPDVDSDAPMFCTVCSVQCLNAASWTQHLRGRKHARNVRRDPTADSRGAGEVPSQSVQGVLVSRARPDQKATTFVTTQVARFLVQELTTSLWTRSNRATEGLAEVSQDLQAGDVPGPGVR